MPPCDRRGRVPVGLRGRARPQAATPRHRGRRAGRRLSPPLGPLRLFRRPLPLQVAIGLDQQGADYPGGEFLLVEQRPRAQSRGTTHPPAAGPPWAWSSTSPGIAWHRLTAPRRRGGPRLVPGGVRASSHP
ncbi:2OG-Fe(II) oxygenase [Streptomyces sp. NPDC054765]